MIRRTTSRMSWRMKMRSLRTAARTDCLARRRNLRMLRKSERARRELYQRVLRKNKCESTGSPTTLSGVDVVSALREERRVGRTSDKKER